MPSMLHSKFSRSLSTKPSASRSSNPNIAPGKDTPSVTVLLVRLHLKGKISNIMNLDPIIRAVQTFVGVQPDGSPGQITWQAIYVKLTGKGWADSQPGTDPIVRAVQTFVGVEPDGSPGQITWKAI